MYSFRTWRGVGWEWKKKNQCAEKCPCLSKGQILQRTFLSHQIPGFFFSFKWTVSTVVMLIQLMWNEMALCFQTQNLPLIKTENAAPSVISFGYHMKARSRIKNYSFFCVNEVKKGKSLPLVYFCEEEHCVFKTQEQMVLTIAKNANFFRQLNHLVCDDQLCALI